MSQEVGQNELQAKTRQLMDGPLKHIKAAVLAAALLPLASVAATPASAQTVPVCSGGISGYVWNDANNNGIQDPGEVAIVGAVVTVTSASGTCVTFTGPDGLYYSGLSSGSTDYTIAVQIPPGMQPSPSDVGTDDTKDSDGTSDNQGNSIATVTSVGTDTPDFGFTTSTASNPGTGTPGYWKNHAWPTPGVTVGGIFYTREQAIAWLDLVGKDKTTTMFSSLVSAKLNALIGNDSSCVASTIAAADIWMTPSPAPGGFGPVGSNVAASSYAWKVGEPLHRLMDNYNNGMLCAPHRQ
jgi:hypothetical protein